MRSNSNYNYNYNSLPSVPFPPSPARFPSLSLRFLLSTASTQPHSSLSLPPSDCSSPHSNVCLHLQYDPSPPPARSLLHSARPASPTVQRILLCLIHVPSIINTFLSTPGTFPPSKSPPSIPYNVPFPIRSSSTSITFPSIFSTPSFPPPHFPTKASPSLLPVSAEICFPPSLSSPLPWTASLQLFNLSPGAAFPRAAGVWDLLLL